MIARLELCLYSGVLRRTLSGGTTVCLLCGLGPQGLGGAGRGRAVRGCCAVCAVFVGILGGFEDPDFGVLAPQKNENCDFLNVL